MKVHAMRIRVQKSPQRSHQNSPPPHHELNSLTNGSDLWRVGSPNMAQNTSEEGDPGEYCTLDVASFGSLGGSSPSLGESNCLSCLSTQLRQKHPGLPSVRRGKKGTRVVSGTPHTNAVGHLFLQTDHRSSMSRHSQLQGPWPCQTPLAVPLTHSVIRTERPGGSRMEPTPTGRRWIRNWLMNACLKPTCS